MTNTLKSLQTGLKPAVFTVFSQTTVAVKIVGTFLCLLLLSMLVYTICRLNRNKQHWEGKGKHGKGKKGVCVKCPNYFCLRLWL